MTFTAADASGTVPRALASTFAQPVTRTGEVQTHNAVGFDPARR